MSVSIAVSAAIAYVALDHNPQGAYCGIDELSKCSVPESFFGYVYFLAFEKEILWENLLTLIISWGLSVFFVSMSFIYTISTILK